MLQFSEEEERGRIGQKMTRSRDVLQVPSLAARQMFRFERRSLAHRSRSLFAHADVDSRESYIDGYAHEMIERRERRRGARRLKREAFEKRLLSTIVFLQRKKVKCQLVFLLSFFRPHLFLRPLLFCIFLHKEEKSNENNKSKFHAFGKGAF